MFRVVILNLFVRSSLKWALHILKRLAYLFFYKKMLELNTHLKKNNSKCTVELGYLLR